MIKDRVKGIAQTVELPFHSVLAAAAAAKSLQSCPTLCDPIDGSPSGFNVHGIFQARTLEWVAIYVSEVTDISPGDLDSILYFIQSSVSHNVLCILVK